MPGDTMQTAKRTPASGPAHRAAGGLVAATLLLVPAAPAFAHPHVWVTVETTVLFEQGSIAGFRHKWTFDEFYTAMAVEGLDTNKDGIYSREELAELAKVNIDGLKEFAFFTYPKLAGQDLALGAPRDYWLEHGKAPADPDAARTPAAPVLPRIGDQPKPGFFARMWSLIFGGPAMDGAAKPDEPGQVLSLVFTLPLKQPVLADAPDFTFAVYDSSFFIALDMGKSEPVKLGSGAPAGCRIDLGQPEAAADGAPRPGDILAPQAGLPGFGFATAKPIRISCGPRT